MKFRYFLRVIRDDGWQHARAVGSHQHFEDPEKPGIVTIAGHPNDEIPRGTLNSMLKQAGLKRQSQEIRMRYTVIYERSSTGYGAYVPDLPGLGVTAPTLEDTRKFVTDGIAAHIGMLREHGDVIPTPSSSAEEFDVRVPA